MLGVWGGALPGGTLTSRRKGGSVLTLVGDASVRRTLITGSLQNTGDGLFQFYMPVYTHALGMSASAIGIVLAAYPAAAFVTRLFLARLIMRFTEEWVLAWAFYMGAASLLLVPLFSGAAVLSLISFVFGLGMGCCGPIVKMQMFQNAPDGRSAEALGLKMAVNNFTKVAMPVMFGSLASAFGMPPMFWINGLMIGAGGYMSQPHKHRRRGALVRSPDVE
jgi:predicted MFS family arabinose efflux permease